MRIRQLVLYIHHATLLTPDERIEDGAVLTDHERIVAVGTSPQVPCPARAQSLDASGLILAPGLIDLQVNGGFGLDFTSTPAAIWEVGVQLPRYGVTTFLPTIITCPLETYGAAQAVWRDGPPPGYLGSTPVGLHFEGPFLNPSKRGAHNPAHLRLPDMNAIADWSQARGVRLVTLAPELPGALDLIRALRERGVVVSGGHSAADYDEARRGLDAGIGYGTHLFNAMPLLEHRAPGLAGALLADANAVVGTIPDGIHLHPAIVALIWKTKGPTHMNLVTDAMAALGMSPSRYRLGDFDVRADETSARLDDGRLAGSILSLDQAVCNLIRFTGCSLSDALSTVTTVPAKLLGLTDRGRVAVGSRADLTLLSRDLHAVATMVGGQMAWERDEKQRVN